MQRFFALFKTSDKHDTSPNTRGILDLLIKDAESNLNQLREYKENNAQQRKETPQQLCQPIFGYYTQLTKELRTVTATENPLSAFLSIPQGERTKIECSQEKIKVFSNIIRIIEPLTGPTLKKGYHYEYRKNTSPTFVKKIKMALNGALKTFGLFSSPDTSYTGPSFERPNSIIWRQGKNQNIIPKKGNGNGC